MGLQFHWTWLKGLSNVKCARWPWAHVLGSLDDTWSQYLKMNSSDLLIGQLVTRGLRFQYEWSNGTFIGKHVRWPWTHVLASLNDTWSQYLKLTWKTLHLALKVMQGSKVSLYVTQWDCQMWSVLAGLEHVLGSLVDTWSQYLILTSYDLHTALKVSRGLKFHCMWPNGTVIWKRC